jgi:hypothetical protein
MATVTEIKAKIEKLEKGLKLKAISTLQKVKMRKQIKELKSELADAQKSAKKPTKKATTKRKAKFNEQDAQRPAKPVGRRTSASGNVYYEYRENRSDKKQPPKRYPRLEDGGIMAKGGGVGMKPIIDSQVFTVKLGDEIEDTIHLLVDKINEQLVKNKMPKLRTTKKFDIDDMERIFVDNATIRIWDAENVGKDLIKFRVSVFVDKMADGGVTFAKGGDVSNKKYILQAYSAEAYEDSYEEGELSFAGAWDDKVGKTFNTKEELLKYINDNIIYSDYSMNNFDWESGNGKYIETDVLCSYSDYSGYIPATESEKELWKQGKKKLYNVHYFIYVMAVIPTEYADGGLTNVGGTTFSDTDLSGLTDGDVSAGYFAKGGKVSSKYKYVPNRMIQAVEVERNGKTTEIDGADILDGLYVKKGVKFAKGGMIQHGLKRGDEIIDDQFWDNSIVVRNRKDGTQAVVKLETGERKETKL